MGLRPAPDPARPHTTHGRPLRRRPLLLGRRSATPLRSDRRDVSLRVRTDAGAQDRHPPDAATGRGRRHRARRCVDRRPSDELWARYGAGDTAESERRRLGRAGAGARTRRPPDSASIPACCASVPWPRPPSCSCRWCWPSPTAARATTSSRLRDHAWARSPRRPRRRHRRPAWPSPPPPRLDPSVEAAEDADDDEAAAVAAARRATPAPTSPSAPARTRSSPATTGCASSIRPAPRSTSGSSPTTPSRTPRCTRATSCASRPVRRRPSRSPTTVAAGDRLRPGRRRRRRPPRDHAGSPGSCPGAGTCAAASCPGRPTPQRGHRAGQQRRPRRRRRTGRGRGADPGDLARRHRGTGAADRRQRGQPAPGPQQLVLLRRVRPVLRRTSRAISRPRTASTSRRTSTTPGRTSASPTRSTCGPAGTPGRRPTPAPDPRSVRRRPAYTDRPHHLRS